MPKLIGTVNQHKDNYLIFDLLVEADNGPQHLVLLYGPREGGKPFIAIAHSTETGEDEVDWAILENHSTVGEFLKLTGVGDWREPN